MDESVTICKDFYNALAQDRLPGSHCQKCGELTIPAKQFCPNCQSDQMVTFDFSGEGKLVAFTVIYVPPIMMAEAGYDSKNPYCSGIVELEEGPRISAQILDVDVKRPENIHIGSPMMMTTIIRGEEEKQRTYLAFKSI
jgi:uncharacterized OB-fold protein